MKHLIIFTISLLLNGLLFSNQSLLAASFNCVYAETKTEISICSDPELSKIDTFLGIIFKKLMKYEHSPISEDNKRIIQAIKKEQQHWINNTQKIVRAI